MITKLGIIAGEILSFLGRNKIEEVQVPYLAQVIKRPEEEVLMSLGWLAREGHVILEEHEGRYSVKHK